MICKAGHTTQMKVARIKLFKKEAYFFMIRGRLYMVCKLFFRLFAIGKQGGYFYMKTLNIIALTIGIIGAVNWGRVYLRGRLDRTDHLRSGRFMRIISFDLLYQIRGRRLWMIVLKWPGRCRYTVPVIIFADLFPGIDPGGGDGCCSRPGSCL